METPFRDLSSKEVGSKTLKAVKMMYEVSLRFV